MEVSNLADAADYAVATYRLGRSFRGPSGIVRALDGVDLKIPTGRVYGLLGPNGAGKTTLTRILCTALTPTDGEAFVLGHNVAVDARTVRKHVGVVFGGDKGLYPLLTARQNLEYWAVLYGVPRSAARVTVPSLLERVGLQDQADQKVEAFSRGMKQRLHLARGLVSDARVLFLDEPTMGMDPIAAREFRKIVVELRAEGRTILLTTHDLAEAEAVCDQVAIIDRGILLAVETPEKLARLLGKRSAIDIGDASESLIDELKQRFNIEVIQSEDGSIKIEIPEPGIERDVLESIVKSGAISIQTSKGNLSDVYDHFIGDRGLHVLSNR